MYVFKLTHHDRTFKLFKLLLQVNYYFFEYTARVNKKKISLKIVLQQQISNNVFTTRLVPCVKKTFDLFFDFLHFWKLNLHITSGKHDSSAIYSSFLTYSTSHL